MPNSNNVYADLFANVTAFNVTTIATNMQQIAGASERLLKKRINTLGKQFAKAIEWYNSEEGQTQMDESGAHFNDVDQFCRALCGRGKSWVYKTRKAFLFCEANVEAFQNFINYIKASNEAGLGSNIEISVEHFNKWASNGCPEVCEDEGHEEGEQIDESAEEGEIILDAEDSGDESAEDSETQFSFSCKNSDSHDGGCIRMKDDFSIIAQDGNTEAITMAMVEYLRNEGYYVDANPNS